MDDAEGRLPGVTAVDLVGFSMGGLDALDALPPNTGYLVCGRSCSFPRYATRSRTWGAISGEA